MDAYEHDWRVRTVDAAVLCTSAGEVWVVYPDGNEWYGCRPGATRTVKADTRNGVIRYIIGEPWGT